MSIFNYFPAGKTPREGQKYALNIVEREWDDYDVFVIGMSTGCHAPGTEVKTFQGPNIKVEDVRVGDILRGPDNRPRTVQKLYSGTSDMYKVTPVKGESFVVNKEHILSIKLLSKRPGAPSYINVSVEEFLSWSKSKKRRAKLYRSAVDYSQNLDTTLDPYILGVWLGDGHSSSANLTTSCNKISDRYQEFMNSVGATVRIVPKSGCQELYVTGKGGVNPARRILQKEGLINNKHIPPKFKYTDKSSRLKLLAGLLDTDGTINKSGFSITQKREDLADDIVEIARSVGLAAYKKKRNIKLKGWNSSRPYYRVSISGDCTIIPTITKIAPPRLQKKDVLCTEFTISSVGIGKYYGFGVDQDHLYLMDDFTVTHNSGKSDTLQTIARWRASDKFKESNATLTPRVVLQEQYKESFPDISMLFGQGRYKCTSVPGESCKSVREMSDACPGCPYVKDREIAKESDNAVFNVHSYLLLKSYKQNLFIDEVQALWAIMSDMLTIKFSKRLHKFKSTKDYGEIIAFLESQINLLEKEIDEFEDELAEESLGVEERKVINKQKSILSSLRARYQKVLYGIKRSPEDYFVELKYEKGDEKLIVRPYSLRRGIEWLWPKVQTRKIVLTSGTVAPIDVEHLGLSKRRVRYINVPMPIPASTQPIRFEAAGNMAFKSRDRAYPRMAKKIVELADRHSSTKGLVHMTYANAEKFRELLGDDPRFMWHTPENKEKVLENFFKAPPGAVLMGSGVVEGLDLAGPQYGWQALTAVPWPSKADKLIADWYQRDIERIKWLAVKEVIQACGRVNRGADDYAITYLLDSRFGNPLKGRPGFIKQNFDLFGEEFIERFRDATQV